MLQGATDLGWTGVDLFFVLSGFLISGILLEAKGSRGYFRNFYLRRALRVFPLYYAYLLAFFVLVVRFQIIGFDARRSAAAAGELPWLWFYGTNILVTIRNSFITASLNHFWTLAIEEHFYFFWPALVFFLDRKKLAIACPVLVLIAIVVRSLFIATTPHSLGVLVFTPCRIDSFAIGGLAAIAVREPAMSSKLVPLARKVLVGSGALILVHLAWISAQPWGDGLKNVIGYTVLALFFCSLMLLAVAARPSSVLHLVFQNRALRFLGKYSYALYVFHNPINIAFNRILPPERLSQVCRSGWVAMLVHAASVGATSIAAAWLSWQLFEKRFLSLKRHFEYRLQASPARPESVLVPADPGLQTPLPRRPPH
jgi:peptidoglycan/LPS O-acetylase OafA/YrhL